MGKKLTDLVIEDEEVSEDLIVDALSQILAFTKSGHIVLKKSFDALSSRGKVLSVFLGLRAMHLVGLRETAGAGPTEASELSGIPLGTIKVYVRQLSKERLLSSEKGQYQVPSHSITRIADILREEVD